MNLRDRADHLTRGARLRSSTACFPPIYNLLAENEVLGGGGDVRALEC